MLRGPRWQARCSPEEGSTCEGGVHIAVRMLRISPSLDASFSFGLQRPRPLAGGAFTVGGLETGCAMHSRHLISAHAELGVNIDHVATLREARYRGRSWGEPDPQPPRAPVKRRARTELPRLAEDRRHILDRDAWELRKVVKTRLNLEMANSPEIVDIAIRLKPEIICIVPERRLEVTTEGGLDVQSVPRA